MLPYLQFPLQMNMNDCGVFVCTYALHLMNIGSKDIQVDMVTTRSYIASNSLPFVQLTRKQMKCELNNKHLRRHGKAVSRKNL